MFVRVFLSFYCREYPTRPFPVTYMKKLISLSRFINDAKIMLFKTHLFLLTSFEELTKTYTKVDRLQNHDCISLNGPIYKKA